MRAVVSAAAVWVHLVSAAESEPAAWAQAAVLWAISWRESASVTWARGEQRSELELLAHYSSARAWSLKDTKGWVLRADCLYFGIAESFNNSAFLGVF